jgi:hypothetical protein
MKTLRDMVIYGYIGVSIAIISTDHHLPLWADLVAVCVAASILCLLNYFAGKNQC